MARAGQMVKRSVTRCEGCCEGSSPSAQFGGEKGDFPIAPLGVRGGREPNYLVLDFVATVSCPSFGFGNNTW